jgi:hypothetical protein
MRQQISALAVWPRPISVVVRFRGGQVTRDLSPATSFLPAITLRAALLPGALVLAVPVLPVPAGARKPRCFRWMTVVRSGIPVPDLTTRVVKTTTKDYVCVADHLP